MKRKLRFAPALVLMLVLLGSVAVAATILYPGTQERFTQFLGEEFGERLGQGDVAEMGTTYVLDDVQYTLSDVIYADGVLYGTVVMEPVEGANIVLMPEDYTVWDPYGVNIYYGDEEAQEGAKSYKEVAQERGAKLVAAKCHVREYLVDGKHLSGECGYWNTPTPEGAVITSFEVYGWNGSIDRSDTYTLVLNPRNRELIEGSEEYVWNSEEWTVEVEPVLKTELVQTPEPAEPMTVDGVELVLPENFTGAMSIFAVEERSFRDVMQPEWVNNSGIVSHEALESRDDFIFADEDWLSVEENGSIYYYAYEGTCEVARSDGSTETLPAKELSGQIAKMAGNIHYLKSLGETADYDWPPQEEPSLITLDDARLQAETLLEKLGIEGAQLAWSYTADMANIHVLCDAYNAKIESGEWPYVEPWEDRALTPEDEGYWLVYTANVDGVSVDNDYMEAYVFVGAAGIRDFVIRAPFAIGHVVETSETIPAEQALALAIEAAKESWIPELAPDVERATRIELIYTVRHKVQLVPVWRIHAVDSEDGAPISVDVSASDGRVLDGPWM